MKNIVMQYPDKTLHVVNVYAANKTSDGQLILRYYDRDDKGFYDTCTSLINIDGKFYKNPAHIDLASLELIDDPKYSEMFIENALPDHILCYQEEMNKQNKNENLHAVEKTQVKDIYSKLTTELKNKMLKKDDQIELFVIEFDDPYSEEAKSNVFFLASASEHTAGKYGFDEVNALNEYDELVFSSIDNLELSEVVKETIYAMSKEKYNDVNIMFLNDISLNLHYSYVNSNNKIVSEIINHSKLLSIDCSDLSIESPTQILHEGVNLKRSIVAVSENDTVYSNNGNNQKEKKYVIIK